jgi:hypothetical protein
MVPHDCSDGFLYAYWRRPAAYLEAHVRSGSSSFWAIGNAAEAGLQDLRRDIETGEWDRRYAKLLDLDEYDAGYRLVIADCSANGSFWHELAVPKGSPERLSVRGDRLSPDRWWMRTRGSVFASWRRRQ